MGAIAWIKGLFSADVSNVIGEVGSMVESFQAGHLGKKELALEIERMIHERDERVALQISAEMTAKTSVIMAELKQEDAYTKRARPTIVYTGPLLVLFIVAVHYSNGFWGTKEVAIPEIVYWYLSTWAGVVGTYVIGRSHEKKGQLGKIGKLASNMTGGKGHFNDLMG